MAAVEKYRKPKSAGDIVYATMRTDPVERITQINIQENKQIQDKVMLRIDGGRQATTAVIVSSAIPITKKTSYDDIIS